MDYLEEPRSSSYSDTLSRQNDRLLEKFPESRCDSISSTHHQERRFHTPSIIVTLYMIILGLSAVLVYSFCKPTRCIDPSQGTYSPANPAIRYLTKVFAENFEKKSEYMGRQEDGMPIDETDVLWEDLYQFGINAISGAEAAQLPNRTSAVPNRRDEFVIELDVFHQLHCLNSLRKSFYPERYRREFGDLYKVDGQRNYTSTTMRHWDHCIDSIRQYIMCHADVATLYWRWVPERQIPLPSLSTTHTCRDFEKIKAWAKEHMIVNDEVVLKWEPGPEENIQLSG